MFLFYAKLDNSFPVGFAQLSLYFIDLALFSLAKCSLTLAM